MEVQPRRPTARIAGNEWHWHGAAPDRLMTHIAITEGDTDPHHDR